MSLNNASELEMLQDFAASLAGEQVPVEFKVDCERGHPHHVVDEFHCSMRIADRPTIIETFRSSNPVMVAGWMIKWLVVMSRR